MTPAERLLDAQRDPSLVAAAIAVADNNLDLAERELKAKFRKNRSILPPSECSQN